MATGAAIIASQALISGSFTIFSEAMNLDFWPSLRIKYPTNVKGQLYIPSVNVFLYVFCVLTIIIFQTSSRMEAAYGLSITITMLMTTVLLAFYLRKKNINKLLVGLFVIFFVSIEGCFLTANLFKFVHGGWFTIMVAGIFCTIMFVWYKAHKIRIEHLSFQKTSDYYSILSDIKEDTTIPKYASNLVYMNRATRKNKIEDKLIYSIINKQPKRADHYWLLHLERLDEPNTLEYSFMPLIKDTLFSINIRAGFRIQPCISIYLRQIIEDLTEKHELDITSGYPSLKKYNVAGDFKFVIIHRVYYPARSDSRGNNIIMNLYSIIKHLGITEEMALGLDTSNVVVEKVPLIIKNPVGTRRIKRVDWGNR